MTVDTSGNLYIADTHNHRIRKVTSGGTISTVAGNGTDGFGGDGGVATSANLNMPFGIAVDASGNLYIADTFNHRIRKVTGANISTVAGNGTQGYSGDGAAATSAGLSLPYGVAVDGSANVYIADTFNHRIRKVTGANISTVAGNGTQGLGGDGGAATNANLSLPYGVAVEASGNIYIADTFNNRLRKVSGSTIGTVIGTMTLPKGVAVKSDGSTVAVSDTHNHRVRKVE